MLVAPAAALAQVAPEEGIPAGRWVLTPALQVGCGWDSNVFRVNGEIESDPKVSDFSGTMEGRLGAALAFRRSLLRLGYRADFRDYAATPIDRNLSHQGSAKLELRFAHGDRLTFTEEYNLGSTDVRSIAQGGELVYDGRPFRLNAWSVELDRSVPGRRGYRAVASGSWLDYEQDTEVDFFEYRGRDFVLEYLEPLSPRLWVAASGSVRSYDDFLAGELGRTPYRRERSHAIQAGIRGDLGARQSISVLVGHGDFEYVYPDRPTSGNRGPVWNAEWTSDLGPRTQVLVGASRWIYPSFFGDQSHYIAESVRLGASRRWRASAIGFDAAVGRTRYEMPDDLLDGGIRADQLRQVRVFLNLGPRRTVVYSISAVREWRESNYDPAEYDATAVLAGFGLGWL